MESALCRCVIIVDGWIISILVPINNLERKKVIVDHQCYGSWTIWCILISNPIDHRILKCHYDQILDTHFFFTFSNTKGVSLISWQISIYHEH